MMALQNYTLIKDISSEILESVLSTDRSKVSEQDENRKRSVGFIDTNLGIDHVIAVSKDFDTYLYIDGGGAFPSIENNCTGDGFAGIKKVEDIGGVIDKDLIVITDCYYGGLADYLRRKGRRVFGASLEWTKIENDRVYGWKRLKEMGVGVPKGTVVKGLDGLLNYIRKNQDGKRVFFIKISKYRGNKETGGSVVNDSEAMTAITQAGFGPYLKDLEILVQDRCPGVELGFDAFFSGDFLRPYFYTIEVKGSGTVAKVVDSCAIDDLILNKIKPSLVETDYRGNISFEFFYDGKNVYCHDPTCFSDDTEVLTDVGWKFFKDLDGSELIVTLNPENHSIEYQKPIGFIEKEYEGNLVRIYGKRNFDLLVTPDHRMYIQKSRHKDFCFVEAKDIPSGCRIPRTGRWEGISKEKFIIDGIKVTWHSGKGYDIKKEYEHKPFEIPMIIWAKFLGIYLAEGHARRWGINITQMKKGGVKKIKEVLDSMKIKPESCVKTID
jgi:hypothetical protein